MTKYLTRSSSKWRKGNSGSFLFLVLRGMQFIMAEKLWHHQYMWLSASAASKQRTDRTWGQTHNSSPGLSDLLLPTAPTTPFYLLKVSQACKSSATLWGTCLQRWPYRGHFMFTLHILPQASTGSWLSHNTKMHSFQFLKSPLFLTIPTLITVSTILFWESRYSLNCGVSAQVKSKLHTSNIMTRSKYSHSEREAWE